MKVGSLVECVKGPARQGYQDSLGNTYDFPQPEIGIIYTIRAFTHYLGVNSGILLEEIVNPEINWGLGIYGEASFKTTRFREIQPPMDIKIEDIISEQVTK